MKFFANHYFNKYCHFEHAKKLFVFDMTLLLSVMALIIATIFWFTYNHGIADMVYLSIKPSAPKIASGEYVTYTISYKNASPVAISSLKLKFNPPIGFILENTEPQENFSDFVFTLPDMSPKRQNSVSVSGYVFGTPNKDEYITAILYYKQEKRETKEEKGTLLIKTLRGSVLENKISAPDYIPANQTAPLSFILKNNSAKPLARINIPLAQSSSLFVTNATASLGIIENNTWKIEYLEPNGTAEIKLELRSDANNHPAKLIASFTPNININKTDIPQSTTEHIFIVAYPEANISPNWQNQQNVVKPQDAATMQIVIKNTGNIDLSNGQISISLPPAIIDAGRLAKLNLGEYKNQNWIINSDQLPALKLLKVNDEAIYNLQMPIAFLPQGGTDITFAPSIAFSADQSNLSNSRFSADVSAPALKIGTQVLVQPEIRYYTKEGDQLGRGPLPPQTGKETKYWAFITIANSTSKISDLKLTAILPNYVSWTGKTSVSHGNNPIFDASQRKISWTLKSLPAHTQAGVYFEISFTPNIEQAGASPILLKDVSFSATDSYINTAINKTFEDLDTSLPNDNQANEKGIMVE